LPLFSFSVFSFLLEPLLSSHFLSLPFGFLLKRLLFPLDLRLFSSYCLLTLRRLLLLFLDCLFNLFVVFFWEIDFLLFPQFDKFKDSFLECVLLLHDLLDVFTEEGLVIIGEFEDMLQGLDKMSLFKVINFAFVGFTNWIVNEDELLLTHVDLEKFLEFILHLLNEVPLIEWITFLPEHNWLFVEGKLSEAHERVVEEVSGEHLAEEFDCLL